MITDLQEIKQRTAARHDEFEVMRYLLEKLADEISDAKLDALVDEVAAPVIAAIDCTQCANCCRSLAVYLTEDDAERLATGVDIPLDSIVENYVDHENAAKVGEWGQFRQQPCALLAGKLCSVYPHRPETCRTYPALTPDFRWTLIDTIEGAAICPIIYNTLDRMVTVTDDLVANRRNP